MGRHVVLSLYGGLGNQLFQVAAGLGVAEELDATLWASREQAGGRAMLWRMLGMELPPAPRGIEVRAGGVPDDLPEVARLLLRGARSTGWAGGRRLTRGRVEEAFDPRPGVLPRRRVIAVNGIHQHADWHARTADRVATMLRAARRTPRVEDPRIVVHLRRGDYVKLGWTLTPQYYREAVRTLADGDTATLVIVSEDALAAGGLARLLEGDGHRCEVHASSRDDEGLVADFWLLADAERLIMSNSTFCWWAAVAGDSPSSEPAATDAREIAFPAGWLGMAGEQLQRPAWTSVASRTDRDV